MESRFCWNYRYKLEIIDLATGRKHTRDDWSLDDVDSFVNHLNKSDKSRHVCFSPDVSVRPVLNWLPLATSQPFNAGYYKVRDSQKREGTAFRNKNGTWTVVGGDVKTPFLEWKDVV